MPRTPPRPGQNPGWGPDFSYDVFCPCLVEFFSPCSFLLLGGLFPIAFGHFFVLASFGLISWLCALSTNSLRSMGCESRGVDQVCTKLGAKEAS